MHNDLQKDEPSFTIELYSKVRDGKIMYKDRELYARLFDLPTVVESSKVIDQTTIIKSADISQILICQYEPFPSVKKIQNEDGTTAKEYVYKHGITPPAKNIKHRRRSRIKAPFKFSKEVEKEVEFLLRNDFSAARIKWELVDPDHLENTAEPCTVDDLFGQCSLSSESDDNNHSNTPVETDDEMDSTDLVREGLLKKYKDPHLSTDETINKNISALKEQVHKLSKSSEMKKKSIATISNVALKARLQESLDENDELATLLQSEVCVHKKTVFLQL